MAADDVMDAYPEPETVEMVPVVPVSEVTGLLRELSGELVALHALDGLDLPMDTARVRDLWARTQALIAKLEA